MLFEATLISVIDATIERFNGRVCLKAACNSMKQQVIQ